VVSILLISAAFAAECPSPTRAEQVGGDVEEAMIAFATLDEDGFRASATKASAELPCLSELMPAGRVAAYHRMMGVRAFLDGDLTGSQRSFAASLAIEPSYVLSAKIAPEGGKLSRAYEAARSLSVSDAASFPVPRGPRTYVDAVVGNSRIPELPAIVQVVDGGTTTLTVYVAGGAPMPSLTGGPAVAAVETHVTPPPPPVGDDLPDDPDEVAEGDLGDEPDEPDMVEDLDDPAPPVRVDRTEKPEHEPAEPHAGGHAGMWVGAAACAGTAGALFATSALTRVSFDNNPTAGKFTVVNGAYYGSVGAGALSLVLAGLAVGGTF
jgi:hypothetical protein